MYEITISPRIKKEIDKLPLKDFKRVDTAIWDLRENPRPQGVKKLKGTVHRIRVGDWRVIYAVFDKDKRVIIGKVERRSEDTYDKVEGLF